MILLLLNILLHQLGCFSSLSCDISSTCSNDMHNDCNMSTSNCYQGLLNLIITIHSPQDVEQEQDDPYHKEQHDHYQHGVVYCWTAGCS